MNRAVSNLLKYQRHTMDQCTAQVRTGSGHIHHETGQIAALLKAGRCAPTEIDAPNHFSRFLLAWVCHLSSSYPPRVVGYLPWVCRGELSWSEAASLAHLDSRRKKKDSQMTLSGADTRQSTGRQHSKEVSKQITTCALTVMKWLFLCTFPWWEVTAKRIITGDANLGSTTTDRRLLP